MHQNLSHVGKVVLGQKSLKSMTQSFNMKN